MNTWFNSEENHGLNILESAEEYAAFQGSFSPGAIYDKQGDLSEAVLSALAEQCTELENSSGYAWSMMPDARTAVFARLQASGRLSAVAADAQRMGIDALGAAISTLILAPTMSLDGLTRTEIEKLRIAKQLLEGVLDPKALPNINCAMDRIEAIEAIDFVRSKQLIGREAELAVLADFALKRKRKRNDNDYPFWMGVTGIGGSGKSALLAEFVHRLRGDRWDGMPVVWIDFERPQFAGADEALLMAEFARQLSMYRPSEEVGLKNFRDRMAKVSELLASRNQYEAKATAASTIKSLWLSYLPKLLPGDESLLLILDTFEEVTLRGDADQRSVEQWISSLAFDYGMRGLRVIFSGRALPPDFIRMDFHRAKPIVVGDLPVGDAISLFNHLTGAKGETNELLRTLVIKFGGNPLLIKILAQLANAEGATAVSELASVGHEAPAGDPLVQGMLYTRILGRLRSREPDIARLAHPGLVLRRVTPDLIQHVLRVPCELKDVNASRARFLFGELARQIWLVELMSDQEVVTHRKDLRRLMLKLMPPDMTARADMIHKLAIDYYVTGTDPHLDPLSQKREANYHALFIRRIGASTKDEARDLIHLVGADIDCIDTDIRADLKRLAGYQLSVDEFATLPASAQVNASLRQADLLHQADGSTQEEIYVRLEAANAMLNNTLSWHKKWLWMRSPKREINSYTTISAFAEGDLEWIAKAAPTLIDQLFVQRYESMSITEGRDLTDSSVWCAALATLVCGDSRVLVKKIEEEYRQRERTHTERWNVESRESLSFQQAIATILQLLDPTARERYKPSINDGVTPRISNTDQLRAFQLLGKRYGGRAQSSPSIYIDLHLLRFASPKFRDIINSPVSGSMIDIEISRWEKMWKSLLDRPVSLASYTEMGLKGPALNFRISAFSSHSSESVHSMLPELYPLIRGALQSISKAHIRKFTMHQFQKYGNYWPVELHSNNLIPMLQRDRNRWLATLIEFADRFGDLPMLLKISDKNRTSSRKLIMVQKLLHALEMRLNIPMS